MARLAFQIVLVLLLVSGTLRSLWIDVNGREAKEPSGFGGVVGTLIVLVILIVLYHGAGALSEIL